MVPLMVLVVRAIAPFSAPFSTTIAQVDAVWLSGTADEDGASPPLGDTTYELMLPPWGVPLSVLAVIAMLLLNAKPKGPVPEMPVALALGVGERVLPTAAFPSLPRGKETIWLAPGTVTNKALPSGVNAISAGAATLPVGRSCVEPAIGSRIFPSWASGTIRKPEMLGDVPAFST